MAIKRSCCCCCCRCLHINNNYLVSTQYLLRSELQNEVDATWPSSVPRLQIRKSCTKRDEHTRADMKQQPRFLKGPKKEKRKKKKGSARSRRRAEFSFASHYFLHSTSLHQATPVIADAFALLASPVNSNGSSIKKRSLDSETGSERLQMASAFFSAGSTLIGCHEQSTCLLYSMLLYL